MSECTSHPEEARRTYATGEGGAGAGAGCDRIRLATNARPERHERSPESRLRFELESIHGMHTVPAVDSNKSVAVPLEYKKEKKKKTKTSKNIT